MSGVRIYGLGGEDPAEFGPYRPVARLASGGMGRIYLARAETGDRELVAVKTLLAEGHVRETDRRRFAREVDLAQRVESAHTAGVLAADAHAERPWMAIEWIPAPSLADLVHQAGQAPADAVHWIAVGTVHALIAMHDHGVVHRDVKPQNILLPREGPRVIDFGISQAVDFTRTTLSLGTIAFTSPEQARGETSTITSDVYSLGATLFHLAVGRPPYPHADDMFQMLPLVQRGAVDLSGLPASLDPLVRACLALDPDDRPSPSEVLARSRRALDRLRTVEHGDHWLTPAWLEMIDEYAVQGWELRGRVDQGLPITDLGGGDGGAAGGAGAAGEPTGQDDTGTREYTRMASALREEREARERAAREREEERQRRADREAREGERQLRQEREARERARQLREERERERRQREERDRLLREERQGERRQREERQRARESERAEERQREQARLRAEERQRREEARPRIGGGVAVALLAALALVFWQPWNQADSGNRGSDASSGPSVSSTGSTGGADSHTSGGGGDREPSSDAATTRIRTSKPTPTRTRSRPTPRPTADRTTTAFRAVSAGNCMTVYDTGRRSPTFDWSSDVPPRSVSCQSVDALVQVSQVTENSCPSGVGKGAWSHRASDTGKRVSLCLTRVYHKNYCVLGKRNGDQVTLGSMTAVDCQAQRVPAAYNQVLHVAGVYRADTGSGASNCRGPNDRNRYWAWKVNDGKTLLCVTVR